MSVQLPVWAAVLVGLLGAVGGLSGVAALINSLSKASSVRVDALCDIIDAQRRRIDSLESEVERLRQEVEKWRQKYYNLATWAKSRGLDPFLNNNPPE